MKFDSLSDFIAMSGHGPYVWGAYAIALVVLGLNVFWPLLRKRKNLSALRDQVERENVILNQEKSK